MAFDPSSLGLPVELSQIPSKLMALWDDAEHRTRACLLNLVVYCSGTEQFASNTELISQFVRNHACRALLVGEVPSASNTPKLSAWIQAHCHVTKAGSQEICSEQITLLAEGLSQTAISNAVMSNLDYDLPLNIWWQGALPENANSPLWQRVDRLIFDSALWTDPSESLHRLTRIRERFGSRITLADLNWTRSLALRQAAAQCFDHPALLAGIEKLSHLEIRHAADSKLTALLLASWFAAQFSWMVAEDKGSSIHFRSPKGASIACTFVTSLGPSVSGLTIRSEGCSLSLEREGSSGLLSAATKTDAGTTVAHYPDGSSNLIHLLSEEMTPGNRHRVYLKALNILQVLIP